MPIDASIPLGVKVPDQMQNLSGLLTVANSAQTLQQSQQKTQQGSIDLQERQNLQGFLADPQNYTDDQGNIDMGKAMPGMAKLAPTTYPKYAEALLGVQKQQTDAKQSLNNLTTDARTQSGKVLYAIPPDTPADVVNKTIDALQKQYKGADTYWNTLRQAYNHSVQQGKGADFLANAARTTLPQPEQQTMNTPGGVPYATGTESGVVSTKPGTSVPVGQKFATTTTQVSPSNQEAVDTDAQGNKFVVTRTPSGAVVGTRPLQSTNPATPGPFTLPPGETGDTLKAVQGIRANANQAARTVPDQQFNANQIIKLAGETNTGKGAEMVQGLRGGYAGLPWTNDAASNYNQLGHYMALQTSQLAQSSGLGGTDAAHGIAAEQAGNKSWTQEAIKSTARVNRALSTGTDLFNRGVENAIESSGSPFAARQFQNQWSKIASVEALRVYDSYKNRSDDPEGWNHVVKELGGPKSEKFQKTMNEVDAMRALVRGH